MTPSSPRDGRDKQDWLADYKRLRKPMPPPERVLPDKRREIDERRARRESTEWHAGDDLAQTRSVRLSLPFADREEAGRMLADALAPMGGPDLIVLGVPRGGVEVAAAVADALDAPMDVAIPKKIGAPGNPELGLGAVAEGVEVLDEQLVRALGVGEAYLREEVAAQQEEIWRRSDLYRGRRPPLDLRGKVAVVVDDGVATGGTARAALKWARSRGAAKVVLAVPVAPADAVRTFETDADRVVALATPEPFFAVGQWYVYFPQVSDERVIQLLAARWPDRGKARG